VGLLRHFSDRSKRALAFAQNEATMMNHDHIGTEHLVLALARTSEGGKELLTEVFTELGLNLAQLREAVGKASPRREPGTPPSEIALAPDTRRSIELADEEATKRDSAVEPVHLLLGVALEGAGVGSSVLAEFGATADRIREVMDRQS
jgi:ATP-dependent Clp protease ATP-binding subunit ClpC